MKILSPFLLLFFCFSAATAQVRSVSENFDGSCSVAGPNYPLNWFEWNNIPPTSALGWNCGPLDGRWGTGAMECTSFYGGVNYLDTAWLFTPEMDLSAYPGKIYLRFDARFEFIAARSLSVLISHNYAIGQNPDSLGVEWVDSTSALSPVINPNSDSANWVTHWIDLTGLKTTPLYVAFRYISSGSAGGIWTIDNVYTTTFGEGIPDLAKENLPVTILGNSTTNRIEFSANLVDAGNYGVKIYDYLGRTVHEEQMELPAGSRSHTISGLNLIPGLYFVKIGNGYTYGVAKTIVP